jgi:hypothetical protein
MFLKNSFYEISELLIIYLKKSKLTLLFFIDNLNH